MRGCIGGITRLPRVMYDQPACWRCSATQVYCSRCAIAVGCRLTNDDCNTGMCRLQVVPGCGSFSRQTGGGSDREN